MKNRRDFLQKTFGLGAGLAAAPHLFATQQGTAMGMDMEMDHMSPGAQRGVGLFLWKRPTFLNCRGAWSMGQRSGRE